MGRKKKKQLKPWCWYCNREFDDEKILIQHQKSKHFKCTFCHKKLYTGPGLSIHSMQVHKEKIDKIPFSLPNRCNVDLEIYGMEGIPDEDIKEHERNKSGKEDEVEEKRPKLESTQILPPFPMHGLPMTPGIRFMHPMPMPVMPPPIQFGLAPPIFVTRPSVPAFLPPPMPRLIGPTPMFPQQQHIPPPIIFNSQDQSRISENDNIPPPPPPPPSNNDVITTNNSSQIPTFPAYSGNSENTKTIVKVSKPTSSTPNIKVVLVHPEDDIPLEQIRLRLAKYSSFVNVIHQPNDSSWTKSSQSHLPMYQNDCKLIPPPPPPSNSYVHPQTTVPQFDRPVLPRAWIAPHLGNFTRPQNFGGSGF